MKIQNYDDQGPLLNTVRQYQNKLFSFKGFRSNYFYASHEITEKGKFSGPAKCYRSSIVVTGL